MSKLWRFLKRYRLFAILSPLLMIGEVAGDLLQPTLMKDVVDKGIEAGNMSFVIRQGLLMLLVVLIGGAFGIMCAYTAARAAQGFGNDLRIYAYKRVMSLSIEQTDKFTTGSLVTRMTNDISMVVDFIEMLLRMCVRAPMFFIFGIIFMLKLNVSFSVVIACALPILALALFLILSRTTPLFSKVQKKIDKVNSVVQENVSGARVVKAYVHEDYENVRFQGVNNDLMQTNLHVMKLMALFGPVITLVMNFSVIAIIYIGGWNIKIEKAGMTTGNVMAAISYSTQILSSVMMVSMIIQSVSRSLASATRIREVIDSNPVIIGGSSEAEDGASLGVEFKNVSFRYPGTNGEPVLKNINLKVRPGETLAIIGATGSGKTSLVNLIPRFYDADEGEVLVDGINVRDYDLSSLRGKISYVMQKSELFTDSVENNIRWGKGDATEEEIFEAAHIAQAAEFIEGFSEGYQTMIAEKGASLSGGQKQRLSIARALLRKPDILILDDSTSALDLVTEGKLQRALKEKFDDSTIIMIAQRIASVKQADRIAVIENGEINYCAPHDELLQISSTYRAIYDSQMKSGAYAEGGAKHE